MIETEKVLKFDVFSQHNKLLLTSDSFNVELITLKPLEYIIMLRGVDFPLLNKGTKINVVVYYINGDRHLYKTTVELSTEFQFNIILSENYTVLQERRRYYKVITDIDANVVLLKRDEKDTTFDPFVPVHIQNLNIGGVFITSDFQFEQNDIIILRVELLNKTLDITSKVLRKQMRDEKIVGYGCCFISLKNKQEEIIARYIHNIQLANKDTIKAIISSRKKLRD